MSIEEQIKTIVKQELEEPLAEIEKSLKTSFRRENSTLKEDLAAIAAQIGGLDANLKEGMGSLSAQTKKENIRIKEDIEALTGQIAGLSATIEGLVGRVETLEEELKNRWSLVVKLRKYTLDQLMSEYKRLTGTMRPEQEEMDENVEI
jgi:peptidoglycan hydrolase CwlO-like protein